MFSVPAFPVAGLVAPDQEDRFPGWIKCEEDPDVAAYGAQLLHIVVAAAFDSIHKGTAERRSLFLKLIDGWNDLSTSLLVKDIQEPVRDLLCQFDLP